MLWQSSFALLSGELMSFCRRKRPSLVCATRSSIPITQNSRDHNKAANSTARLWGIEACVTVVSHVLSAGRGILLVELLHQNVFRFLVTQGKAAVVARLPGTQKLEHSSQPR